jgi:hypothetical protein
MRKLISTCLACIGIYAAQAQVTLGSGEHTMEIGGVLSTYYNYRPINADASNQNQNKDRFKLRDARLRIEGKIGNKYEYRLQMDFSSLGSNVSDPESPSLYDANITYKGFKPFDITVGYGKLPYSRASQVGFTKSPYWQRAELVRGDVFSRRDVGITLTKTMLNQQINAYAGVYSGVGEVFFQGDNDPSGAPEFIGRVDFSYPCRYRYQDIDTRHVPIPMFQVGVNGRYTKRDLPSGEEFIEGQTGPYGIKAINGKRYMMGLDASFQYQGFSAQFEMHKMRGTPQDPNDPLLRSLGKDLTGGYFQAGGLIGQLNYFVKPAKTILSVRYDQLDLNDLVPGRAKHFSAAIAYQLKGFSSMIKAQYWHNIEDESIDQQRWKNQFRIGWQFAIE